MVVAVSRPTGTLYAEVNAALVDDAELDAAAAVLARVSRFMQLGRQVGVGAAGWEPALAVKWFEAVDPDRPPRAGVKRWRAAGVGALGFYVADEPDTLWVRRGQGVRGVIETVAHEATHASQLQRFGWGFYVARFRAGLLEDEARASSADWRDFFDRHPAELRRAR